MAVCKSTLEEIGWGTGAKARPDEKFLAELSLKPIAQPDSSSLFFSIDTISSLDTP